MLTVHKPMTEQLHASHAADPTQAAPPGAAFLARVGGTYAGDASATHLEAALVDTSRRLQALRERLPQPSAEQRDMLARGDALLARASAAARDRRPYLARDCLQQLDRELVLALTDDERRAAMALALAESRAALAGWRQDAAEALAALSRGDAPSAAVLQAVMLNLHEARQQQRRRAETIRQQLPMLVVMLGLAVLFFSAWGLLGGFDWLARDDVEVTVGMMLVSGVLMGFFGGLVSFAFSWVRFDIAARLADRRAQRWLSLARPAVGAAVAVPIVLLVEAGLVNLGQLSPALVLAVCFLGGFSERWFMARLDRIVGGGAER
jgi:uncharacterized membrane protein YidH (DUF202 family)